MKDTNRGLLTGRISVPMILPNKVDVNYNPFDNLYSGVGTSLTPKQLDIAFDINRNERKYPTGIFVENPERPRKFDAIKYTGGLNRPQTFINKNGEPKESTKMLHFVMKGLMPGAMYYYKGRKGRVIHPIHNMPKSTIKLNKSYIKLRMGHAH